MSLFALGDTHLSFGSEKPMDIFAGWSDYESRLEKNWRSVVGEDDTVVICGDVSWAMKLDEAMPDLSFLDSLPGKKLLMKGNHDYWWETVKKMKAALAAESISSIDFLYNNAFALGDICIAGTKGWFFDSGAEDEAKALNRELCRLRLSLEQAKGFGGEPVVFLHYPPISHRAVCEEIIDVLCQFGVKRCYYAHLHGPSIKGAYVGEYRGVNFSLVSGDSLGFCPKLIKKV